MSAKKVKVKPGKAQSQMGFIVGLIFVGIGNSEKDLREADQS